MSCGELGEFVISECGCSLARPAHPSDGRRIETPRGGEHRRPPTLGTFVIELLFWQAFLAFLAFLAFWPKISKKSFQNSPKSRLGASKIEPGGLQNRARSPPRRHFLKTLNLRGSKWAAGINFIGFKSQLGPNLEAQDPPKSRPKPEKIDVQK